MKILITGGAGFIGSSLIEALNKMGLGEESIFIYHPNWFSKWKNLVGLKYQILNNFLESIDDFYTYLKEFNLVIHLGANSSTTMSPVSEAWNKNFTYSTMLIQAANALKIPIIFASSASVYGSEEKDFSERVDGLAPTGFYAFSKLKVDEYIEKLLLKDTKSPSPIYSFRFFNVYGGKREQYKDGMSSVIYRWLTSPSLSIELFKSNRSDIADGEQTRDFIHINDVCSVIIHVIGRLLDKREKPYPSGIYNLGTGMPVSYNEIAKKIASLTKKRIVYKALPSDVEKQYQYRTCANLKKLKNVLEYTDFFIEIQEGINLCYKSIN